MSILNNREIALSLWTAALLVFALSRSTVRSPLAGALRSLLHPKISSLIVAGLTYTGVVVILLHKLGLWNQTLIKDTGFWFLFTALTTGFSLINDWKGEPLFRKLMLDALNITAVVEFISSEYTLSLPWELALVPIMATLGGMQGVAASDSKFASVGRVIVFAIVVVTVALIGYSVHGAYADWKHFYSVESLRKFALPIELSLLFMPFIFCILLFVTYESVFTRLSMGSQSDATLLPYAKKRIIRSFGFGLRKLRHFLDTHSQELVRVRSKGDLDELLDTIEFQAVLPRNPPDAT